MEELVKKVIEPGVDVNGQPKKTTKWLPTDIVSYDEKHKQYVITTPSFEEAVNDAVDNMKDPIQLEEKEEAPVASDNVEDAVVDNVENTEEIPSGDAIFE